MTLPDTPFLCKGINLTAALRTADDLGVTEDGHNLNAPALKAIIAAAIGETIPAEVETDTKCECFKTGDPDCPGGRSPKPLGTVEAERFITEWQPTTSQSQSNTDLVLGQPVVSDTEEGE